MLSRVFLLGLTVLTWGFHNPAEAHSSARLQIIEALPVLAAMSQPCESNPANSSANDSESLRPASNPLSPRPEVLLANSRVNVKSRALERETNVRIAESRPGRWTRGSLDRKDVVGSSVRAPSE